MEYKKFGMGVVPFRTATDILNDVWTEAANSLDQQDLSEDDKEKASREFSAFVAWAALSALRAEIVLKAGLEGHGITPPIGGRGHDLCYLFSKLPEKDRQQIKCNVKSSDFDGDLSSMSNAFVEWRYFFESDRELNIGFMKSFLEVAERVLRDPIAKSRKG